MALATSRSFAASALVVWSARLGGDPVGDAAEKQRPASLQDAEDGLVHRRHRDLARLGQQQRRRGGQAPG